MTDNEFLLFDRLEKIKSVIGKYGEENFYISFSGGKDSTVLSALIDMALPNNNIPRVYADTGIELNMIRDFVTNLAKNDDRIDIIKPSVPIRQMLEQDGYPFKSKVFSQYVKRYRDSGNTKSVLVYTGQHLDKSWSPQNSCPKKLKYLFTDGYNYFPISDKCCDRMKKKPMKKYSKDKKRPYSIIGVMRSEGGVEQRQNVSHLAVIS